MSNKRKPWYSRILLDFSLYTISEHNYHSLQLNSVDQIDKNGWADSY